ncbi:3-oxoacyl-ACP synthase III family protein [Riemerella columbina]|uniref:3-oxoacyl-ACP synthase III family protein n=1 Tax=Riemerella columbina TaxID=103810 RepID=UPI000361FB09|nr:ketoacyl-ACP synthase III [Riemerella columbina]
MPNTVIIGSGCYIPSKIIKGSEFKDAIFFDDNRKHIDKPNEEIIKKFVEITEIEERRYVEDTQYNSDIGLIAAQEAIEDAGIDAETLDYIIYASNYGEVGNDGVSDFMPSMSARLKHKLGIKNRSCINYDMIFGCPGWVEGLILADTLIKAGKAQHILVVGSETLSKVTDPFDRNKMIFADGAGAVVVKASDENAGLLESNTLCFNNEEICYLENGSSLNPDYRQSKNYIRMKGRKIYEFALRYVPDAIKATIDKAGLDISDIDKILIHQANAKMDHAMISRLFRLYGIKNYDEAIAPMTVQKLGNSSVATIPTMFNLIKKGQLEGHSFKEGGYIIFASVGAGMNINAVVYKNR